MAESIFSFGETNKKIEELSAHLGTVDVLYDYNTEVGANSNKTYALSHNISNYKFIVLDLKVGSALASLLFAVTSLNQTSSSLDMRNYISINGSIYGQINVYKAGETQLNVQNGTSASLAVKITGIIK